LCEVLLYKMGQAGGMLAVMIVLHRGSRILGRL
jgi:hypothetical protein